MQEVSKLLLLDKDDTLVQTVSGQTFINQPWDQQPLPGVVETLDRYVTDGWTPVIVSNQAGVAAGHKSIADTIQEMLFALELFPAIAEAFFCPDFQGAECYRVWNNCDELHRIIYDPQSWDVVEHNLVNQFRKPSPGMLILAQMLHFPDHLLMVGDRPEDEQAAVAAGMPFMWANTWRQGNEFI